MILLQRCEPHPQLADTHKQNAEQSKDKARNYTVQSNDIINTYKDKLKKKDAEIDKLKRDAEINNNILNAKLKRLTNFKNSDVENYYIDRFNTPQAIKTVNTDAVEIKDTLSRLIISDLIKYDAVKYDFNTLKKEYFIVNDKFNLANKTVDTLKISISNISTAYENTDNERLQQIKQVEKQVKQERRKKNVWKIATFAVLGGGIYLLAK